VPAISGTVNVSLDSERFLCNNKASIFVCDDAAYVAAVVNSPVAFWFTQQVFATKQGGFYDFEPRYSCQWPIPAATPEQKIYCERLAEALIWLHRPGVAKKSADAPVSLMSAYFEQWLNGLVYELFFPDELHARNLRVFDETAKLAPPALEKLSDQQKLSRLKELFDQAYDIKAPLRAMLFSLPSLESVRIIEGESQPKP
jgi:hypothetical protein